MAKQSVLDIKFKDLTAGDLKNKLNRTLEEFVKDLMTAASGALGVSGQMTDLGVIPAKTGGGISGVRFGIDENRFADVQKAINGALIKFADKADVDILATAHRNSRYEALKREKIRIYDDDLGTFDEYNKFLENVGGRTVQSWHNKHGYTTYEAVFPNAHYKGNPLSSIQDFRGLSATAENVYQCSLLEQQRLKEEEARNSLIEEAKIREGNTAYGRMKAARETGGLSQYFGAFRKPDTGLLSDEADDRYFADQEERRRKLGIVHEDDSADRQDLKTFFKKTLAALGVISSLTGKILQTVVQVYKKDLQTTYNAQSAGVSATTLATLENALESMGIKKENALGALSLLQSGLANPYNFNTELVNGLAPIYNKAGRSSELSKMTLGMLQGTLTSASALDSIMEASRSAVDNGWEYSLVYNQLRDKVGESVAEWFKAYYNYYSRPANSKKSFQQFAKSRPAINIGASAERGSLWTRGWTAVTQGFENFIRDDAAASAISNVDYVPTIDDMGKLLGLGDINDWSRDEQLGALETLYKMLDEPNYKTTGFFQKLYPGANPELGGGHQFWKKINDWKKVVAEALAGLESGYDFTPRSINAGGVVPVKTGLATTNSVQLGTNGFPTVVDNSTRYVENNYGELTGRGVDPNTVTGSLFVKFVNTEGKILAEQQMKMGQNAYITMDPFE